MAPGDKTCSMTAGMTIAEMSAWHLLLCHRKHEPEHTFLPNTGIRRRTSCPHFFCEPPPICSYWHLLLFKVIAVQIHKNINHINQAQLIFMLFFCTSSKLFTTKWITEPCLELLNSVTVIFRTIRSWHKVQRLISPLMKASVPTWAPLMYLGFAKLRELLAQIGGVFLQTAKVKLHLQVVDAVHVGRNRRRGRHQSEGGRRCVSCQSKSGTCGSTRGHRGRWKTNWLVLLSGD